MTNTTTTTTTNAADVATTGAELVAVERKALDTLNKSMARTSLDDLLMGARRSLLLVDVSGSMGESIRSGKRKIDALREVVKSLIADQPVPVAAFGSYSGVQMVSGSEIPEPTGGTPLHDAIDFGAFEGATHLVVVTDGIPDCERSAFAAAARFKSPIDVFYIGDGNDHGADFARRLAAATGGTFNTTDLGAPKQLASAIRGLLGDGGL